MTLPTTDANKGFEENKTVQVGDPTEAAADHDTLAENTDWLKETVRLSKHGEIETDARGQTSVPGVFAAGDCTTVPYKQIVTAMGDGAAAALGAFDHLIRAPLAAVA